MLSFIVPMILRGVTVARHTIQRPCLCKSRYAGTRPRSAHRAICSSIVRGNHSALGAIHEDSGPAAFCRDFITERTNQVRTANARVAAEHFRMNRVVYQRGKRFTGGLQCLNDMTSRVIQLLGVIVESNLSLSLVRCDLELAGSRFPTASLIASAIRRQTSSEVFWISRRSAFAIRKSVTIRRTVRVGGADKYILRRKPADFSSHFVAQRSGKSQEIRTHNRYPVRSFFKYKGAHRQIVLFSRDFVRGPIPPITGKSGSGVTTRTAMAARNSAAAGKDNKRRPSRSAGVFINSEVGFSCAYSSMTIGASIGKRSQSPTREYRQDGCPGGECSLSCKKSRRPLRSHQLCGLR